MPTYSAISDAEVAPEAPVTTSLMTRLRDNALAFLGAPAGTAMLFRQSSAPTGWTRSSAHNDKALRLTSGSISGGGSLGFNTVFSRQATDAFTLLETHLPNLTKAVNNFTHQHPYDRAADLSATAIVAVTGGTPASGFWRNAANPNTSDNNTPGGPPSISFGGSSSHAHGIDLRVAYVDVIEATRDA